ncbi:MAG TPA: CheB methylesterase domain-containing protein, partial [Polyangiaceae bacterium]|nr:CheB methylesterase domain-containing protein [Polyangiaceae bacterium]
LIARIKLVARIKVITHPRARLRALSQFHEAPVPPWVPRSQKFKAAALGASTGGPSAIVEVLRGIEGRLPVPLFLVLHIDEPFGASFAEWLADQAPHPVVFARGGEAVAELVGSVVMARPGKHLALRDGAVHLTVDPERHSCRPSVDVLFESVAAAYGAETLACLLTGMGRDGATGLLAVKRAGGLTIAQDEATSVVYGMPREAALLGAAHRILPLAEIGPAMGGALFERKGGHWP